MKMMLMLMMVEMMTVVEMVILIGGICTYRKCRLSACTNKQHLHQQFEKTLHDDGNDDSNAGGGDGVYTYSKCEFQAGTNTRTTLTLTV